MEKESTLAARIREGCRLGRREAVEVQNWEEFRSRRGEVVCLEQEGGPEDGERVARHVGHGVDRWVETGEWQGWSGGGVLGEGEGRVGQERDLPRQ